MSAERVARDTQLQFRENTLQRRRMHPDVSSFWDSLVVLDPKETLDVTTASGTKAFVEPFTQTSSAPAILPFSEMTIVPDALSPFESTSSEKVPTIYDFYSVEAEAQFLQDHASLTDSERKFYVHESVSQFLNEFAGNLPYSSITYLKKADGLYYGSVKADELYKKTAQMTPGGSREWAEYEGFLRSQEVLETSDEAGWWSLPRINNYTFVFDFVSTGSMVRMNIVRYPEKMYDVSKSLAVVEKVTGKSYNFSHAHDFLKNPIAMDGNALPRLLDAAGVSRDDIEKAAEFERRVGIELSDWMNEYYVKLSSNDGELSPEKKVELETLIAAMYNRACEIREEIHAEGLQKSQNRAIHTLHVDNNYVMYAAQSRSLAVAGGGSCPTVKRNGFLSQKDIAKALDKGAPLEPTLHSKELLDTDEGEGYECPRCGLHYEDETDTPPEKKTKICVGKLLNGDPCEFKFGCK